MSPIYRNIFIYRFVMNILYFGKYNKRFKNITKFVDIANTRKIVELAFGDIQIAMWAKSNNIDWVGFDINKSFVLYAKENGYDAFFQDIQLIKDLPESDLTIISGSLYHFHTSLESLVNKVMSHTKSLIISEPIHNISSMPNILGRIARNSKNVAKGKEKFSYNEKILIDELQKICLEKYHVNVLKRYSKDLILEISHIEKE